MTKVSFICAPISKVTAIDTNIKDSTSSPYSYKAPYNQVYLPSLQTHTSIGISQAIYLATGYLQTTTRTAEVWDGRELVEGSGSRSSWESTWTPSFPGVWHAASSLSSDVPYRTGPPLCCQPQWTARWRTHPVIAEWHNTIGFISHFPFCCKETISALGMDTYCKKEHCEAMADWPWIYPWQHRRLAQTAGSTQLCQSERRQAWCHWQTHCTAPESSW